MEDLHPLPKAKHSSFQIYMLIRNLELYLSALRKKKSLYIVVTFLVETEIVNDDRNFML